ncbi:MAG: 2-amino-4-hydroxy-6-hydroxymethyldihydropteridine diphosphokinase [Lachnospiraceae bacterium]|nr:2-amino-4-hydroxy-6-hydroxymethyldihydropteridine diphosphokinase [Lachnospiraceae bacterium]
MADYIRIRDLEVYANHGVFKEENTLGQKFLFSFEMEVDMKRAGVSDNLDDSVNYGEVCRKVHDFAKANTYRLLEALAESVSRMLLMEFPQIISLKTEIKKPWAPVGLPLDTVSVEIMRSRHQVYLSIGSNMGNKEAYLKNAIQELDEHPMIHVRQVSDFLVTEPYGGVEQDDFLNGCVELETVLYPEELLDALHEIEQHAGRTREIHWGPRTLDLDILFYDDLIMDTENLTIPHREIPLRDFVLSPLSEIAPDLYHPVLNKTILQLKDECKGKSGI